MSYTILFLFESYTLIIQSENIKAYYDCIRELNNIQNISDLTGSVTLLNSKTGHFIEQHSAE